MLVHESPEKLTVQEDPGWGWGLGGVLAAIALVALSASAGIFQGVTWSDPFSRGLVTVASSGMLLVGVVLLLRCRDWTLEMNRIDRKAVLFEKGIWPRHVNTWNFQEVLGTRLVSPWEPGGSWSLEILVASGKQVLVAHCFRSDKAGCQRASRAIERVLGEPPWEAPAVSLRARVRM